MSDVSHGRGCRQCCVSQGRRHALERKAKGGVEGWGCGHGVDGLGHGCGGLRAWVWIFTHHPCLPPQLRQRFELEIERMKQMHQKDREDQEEELEDVRQSCQKRVREL